LSWFLAVFQSKLGYLGVDLRRENAKKRRGGLDWLRHLPRHPMNAALGWYFWYWAIAYYYMRVTFLKMSQHAVCAS